MVHIVDNSQTRISTLASGEFSAEKSERDTVSPQVTPGRRYTIVKNGLEKKSPAPYTCYHSPHSYLPHMLLYSRPVVQTSSQSNSVDGQDFTMYDAIPESNLLSNQATDPVDPEMAKFLPMLQEYLRSMPAFIIVHLMETNCIPVNDEPSNISSTSTKGDQGEEYVWDVFYHRPAITGLVAVANIATVCVTHDFESWRRILTFTLDLVSLPSGNMIQILTQTRLVMTTMKIQTVRTIIHLFPSDVTPYDVCYQAEDFYRNDYPDEDPDQSDDDAGLSGTYLLFLA